LPAVLELDVLEERSRRYVVYSALDAMLETTFGALDDVELTLEGLAATGLRSTSQNPCMFAVSEMPQTSACTGMIRHPRLPTQYPDAPCGRLR
jgi:hypothetical protein